MQRYDSYKDSGEQWLGEIPSHWEVRKAKYLWKETNERSEYGSEDLLSVSQYEGVRQSKDDSRSESLKGYKIVKDEDLVINIMLAWLGGLGVSNYEGIVSPAYCTYKLIDKQNPRFLHYLYRTPLYLAEFARRSTGIVPSRWRMYTDDFGQVLTLLPPLEEQKRMVEYLDVQTAQIDEAIAQQQKMIDLLNERKQIIINNAVTKGLNPDVPMKDSGVEWIGQIPKNWTLERTKACIKEIETGVWGNDPKEDGTDIICYRVADFDYQKRLVKKDKQTYRNYGTGLSAKNLLKKGDLLLEKSGGGEKYPVGRVVVFPYENEIATCSNFIQILRTEKIVIPEYLCYFFYSSYSKGLSWYCLNQTTGIQNLQIKSFLGLPCCLPSIEEQKDIVKYLNYETERIEDTIKKYNCSINLLQERKQIIINEVVTGKIKV